MKTNKERLEFIRSIDANPSHPIIKFAIGYEFVGVARERTGQTYGSDGFGYEWDGERWVKFPHYGDVKIGKDVEIGVNTSINRATLKGECTEIGDGTKINDLVHIAHNCKIGKHCLIGAGVIIGGSVRIGDRVLIWGSCYIERKLTIGDDAEIRAGSAVFSDVGAGEVWAGNPAKLIFKRHDKK